MLILIMVRNGYMRSRTRSYGSNRVVPYPRSVPGTVSTYRAPGRITVRPRPTVGNVISAYQRYKPFVKAGYQVGKYLYNRFRGQPKAVRARATNPIDGLAGGRFKRGRFKKFTKKQAMAVTISRESKGLLSQASAVAHPLFVGHTTGSNDLLLDGVCLAIARNLCMKAGYDCTNAEHLLRKPSGGIVAPFLGCQLVYTLGENSAALISTIPFTDGSTLRSFSEAISDAIDAAIGSATIMDAFIPWRIGLIGTDNAYTIATLDFSSHNVVFMSRSSMQLQNRTIATTDLTVDEDVSNNVARNPLKGVSYESNGNGLRWRDQLSLDPLTEGFTYSSVITFNDTVPYPSQMLTDFPRRDVFYNCKGTRGLKIEPGEIKKSFLMSKKRMSLVRYFRVISPWLRRGATTGANPFIPLGQSRVFALDRMLDSGSAEPNLVVGFECDSKVSVNIVKKKIPMLEIQT